MITIITTKSELEKVKSLLPEEIKIVHKTETGNIVAINIKPEGIPFELSANEIIRSLKMIFCGKGDYEETDAIDRKKVCVIGSFKDDTDMVFLAKK